jgi:hypothetical protein
MNLQARLEILTSKVATSPNNLKYKIIFRLALPELTSFFLCLPRTKSITDERLWFRLPVALRPLRPLLVSSQPKMANVRDRCGT